MQLELLKSLRSQDFEGFTYDSIYLKPEIYTQLEEIAEQLRADLSSLFRLSPGLFDMKLGVMPVDQWLNTPSGREAYTQSIKITSMTRDGSKGNEYLISEYVKEYPQARVNRKNCRPFGGGNVPTMRYVVGWLISTALERGWSIEELRDNVRKEQKNLMVA